jgi:hypothetical protein
MPADYYLKRPITIDPATKLEAGPVRTEHHEQSYEILIALDKDHTATLTVHQSDVDELPGWFGEIQ